MIDADLHTHTHTRYKRLLRDPDTMLIGGFYSGRMCVDVE